MLKVVWTLLLLLALPALGQQSGVNAQTATPGAQGNQATDQQLIQKEKNFWEAWKNKNSTPFEQDTATEVPGVSREGLVTTQQMLQDMKNCEVASYSIEEPRVDWASSDVAVVTYKANQDATCNGKKVPPTVWAQSVWTKKNGKWIAVSHQEVPAGGPSTPNPQ